MPDDRLDAAVDELVDAVLASSRLVVGLGKRRFYALADMTESRRLPPRPSLS